MSTEKKPADDDKCGYCGGSRSDSHHDEDGGCEAARQDSDDDPTEELCINVELCELVQTE